MPSYNLSSSIVVVSSFFVSSSDVLRSGGGEDTNGIKPIFSLNGNFLSEHNLKVSVDQNFNFVKNTNHAGNSNVYFPSNFAKRVFNFSWSYLPGSRASTVDKNHGRDYVYNRSIEQKVHVLKVRELNTSGLVQNTFLVYNVVFESYSESLIRRDINNDEYYWDCQIVLRQI